MLGCDHPRFVPIALFIGELWHFHHFPIWRPSAILNFKNFNHWSCDCDWGRNVSSCCVLNVIKIGSCVWPPDAHNCWMLNAPLLGSGRCYGNHIMADMSGTWWDVTTQVSFKPIHRQASYSMSNIFQYGGRAPSWIGILSFWTIHEVNAFDYPVKIWCPSGLRCRRYCDFMILLIWLENSWPRPFLGDFWGLNPLQLWIVIKTAKRHILGWGRVIKPSRKRFKIRPGVRPARERENEV